MVASLSRMFLPLSPGLRSILGALGLMFLHLSPTLVSHSGCSGPHVFTFVAHLSPTLVYHSGFSGPRDFTCVSHLSPTLGCHSECSGPHDFTLVSHLSPTLVSHPGCSGPHAFTFVSHLSPTLGALGRLILQLSPTCFPLWVLWAAWFYTCLPLSHLCSFRVSLQHWTLLHLFGGQRWYNYVSPVLFGAPLSQIHIFGIREASRFQYLITPKEKIRNRKASVHLNKRPPLKRPLRLSGIKTKLDSRPAELMIFGQNQELFQEELCRVEWRHLHMEKRVWLAGRQRADVGRTTH